MNKTTNLYVRVEPEVKESAESILSQLGIPMSNAVGMFLKQVVLHRGLPFSVTLPAERPIDVSLLTEEELSSELKKGFDDYEGGRTAPAKAAFDSIREKYSL